MAFDFREEALRGLVALREALDHLIGESFTRHAGGHATAPGSFSVDVFEQDARYILQASLPGVKPEDLVIQAQGNLIAIRGERRLRGDQTDQQWILREHQPSTFFRSIALPGAIDAVAASAHLEYGLLTLELPKAATVSIIPLGTHAVPDAATAAADGEPATLDSSSALPTDSGAATMADSDTIPELAALAPPTQDEAEVMPLTDEADAEAAPPAEAETASVSEDATPAPIASEDEAPVAESVEEAENFATEEVIVEASVAAEAVAETLTAILEAEAIVEAAQEAAIAAELAAVTEDEATSAALTEIAGELAAVEEILIAEEIIAEELAAVVAEAQLDSGSETSVATAIAEAEIMAVELLATEIVAIEAEEAKLALEIAATNSLAEAEISEQREEVVATVPETDQEVMSDSTASAAEVAAAEALTAATHIAEELVAEILHEVESEIVREIVAEMAEAQRDAVADVIAEALLADVVSADALTAMSPADVLSADAEATAVSVEAVTKLEEVH